MTRFPDNRTTARQQTHRQHSAHVLLVALEIPRWVRQRIWGGVGEDSQRQTHDFFSVCLGLAPTHTQCSYSQQRSRSEKRVLGLLGGRLTYVWEMMDPAGKHGDDEPQWGGGDNK